MMERVVALVGGGIDSTTMVADLRNQGHHVLPVHIHVNTKAALRDMAAVKHSMPNATIIYLPSSIFVRTALVNDQVAIPHGTDYRAAEMRANVIPNRNAIFLTIAYAIAVDRNYDSVAMGLQTTGDTVFRDCTPAFVDAVSALESVVFGKEAPALHVPYLTMHKSEIIARAHALGVDLASTWSCYEGVFEQGVWLHCGHCGACLKRKEGFALAQSLVAVRDPTRYAAASPGS